MHFLGGDILYTNNAYYNNTLHGYKDKTRPLIVCSVGTYHLYTKAKLPTYRPRGRLDYQLLYVASGQGHFYLENDKKDTIVTAGHIVLYRPKEMQKYVYYGDEQTEVYWVHFTGNDVKNIIRKYSIKDDMRVIYCGTSLGYTRIFKQMIYELQKCQIDYEELLSMLLRQIFISLHRQITQERKIKNEYLEYEMELATQYFMEHYNTEISVEDYASSRGMSISWFIRSFKEYVKTTPMQYIVTLRITNAQILLETTKYSIKEISRIVGYENPLYFSRIFHKQKGISPSIYRRQQQSSHI